MRARDFILLEYKHDVTMRNYGEKFRDRMLGDMTITASTQSKLEDAKAKGIGPSSDTFTPGYLRRIEQSDPTPNREYTQWMVRSYINRVVNYYEDVLSTLAGFAGMFNELKIHRRLPEKYRDINQIKTREIFRDAYRAVADRYEEFRDEQQEQKPLSKGHAQEVYNGPEVRIIHPVDQAAACYYGQGTQWCTASTRSQNYFNDYNNEGPLLILIPKKPAHEGEKYQLHAASEQVMDEHDSSVPMGHVVSRFPNTNLGEILIKFDPEWKDFAELMHPDDLKRIVRLYNQRLVNFNKWILDQYTQNSSMSKQQQQELKAAAERAGWPNAGTFTYDQFAEYLRTGSIHSKERFIRTLVDLSYDLLIPHLRSNDALEQFDKTPRDVLNTQGMVGLSKRNFVQTWTVLLNDWRIRFSDEDPDWATYVGPTNNSMYNNAVGYTDWSSR